MDEEKISQDLTRREFGKAAVGGIAGILATRTFPGIVSAKTEDSVKAAKAAMYDTRDRPPTAEELDTILKGKKALKQEEVVARVRQFFDANADEYDWFMSIAGRRPNGKEGWLGTFNRKYPEIPLHWSQFVLAVDGGKSFEVMTPMRGYEKKGNLWVPKGVQVKSTYQIDKTVPEEGLVEAVEKMFRNTERYGPGFISIGRRKGWSGGWKYYVSNRPGKPSIERPNRFWNTTGYKFFVDEAYLRREENAKQVGLNVDKLRNGGYVGKGPGAEFPGKRNLTIESIMDGDPGKFQMYRGGNPAGYAVMPKPKK